MFSSAYIVTLFYVLPFLIFIVGRMPVVLVSLPEVVAMLEDMAFP